MQIILFLHAQKRPKLQGDEVEMRRNEYEALNNQVKSVMPRTITNVNRRIAELVHGVHEADGRLIAAMDALLQQRRQQVGLGHLVRLFDGEGLAVEKTTTAFYLC